MNWEAQIIPVLLSHYLGNIYWIDSNNILRGCNNTQAQYLGFESSEQVCGKHLKEILNADEADGLIELHQQLMHQQKPSKLTEVTTYQGEQKTFLSNKIPLTDKKSGKPLGILGLSLDITEHEALKESMICAEKAHHEAQEIKSVLIDCFRHDLATPVHYSGLLLEHLIAEEHDPEKLEYLSYIKQGIDALFQHCSSLQNRAKSKQLSKVLTHEPLDLHALCENILAINKSGFKVKNLTLNFHYDDNIPTKLLGDNYRIQAILSNLVSNAIKFTDKGSVTVSVKMMHPITSGEERRALIGIIVSDTGRGIAKHIRQQIFEDFSMEKPSYMQNFQGLGLGLSLVREFVMRDLKGELDVNSEEGQGTTLSVFLPLRVSLQHNDADTQ